MRYISILAIIILLIGCNNNYPKDLVITKNALEELRLLRAKKKFEENLASGYPGPPSERTRADFESGINHLIADILSGIEQNPSSEFVFDEFKRTMKLFESADSVDQDRFLDYLEQIMDILNIESSNGLLNTWRYGFDVTT